jgi:hypothetical protein
MKDASVRFTLSYPLNRSGRIYRGPAKRSTRDLFERILSHHFSFATWLSRFGERHYSSPNDVAIAKHFEMLVDVSAKGTLTLEFANFVLDSVVEPLT